MRRFLRGLVKPSIPLFMVAAAFPFLYNFAPSGAVYIVINAIVLGLTVLIIRAYGPILWGVMRRNEPSEERYLLMGIVVLWLSYGMSRLWITASIFMGRPDWMANHWFLQLCYLTGACSGYWFLAAPRASKACGYPTYAVLISLAVITGIMLFEYLNVTRFIM